MKSTLTLIAGTLAAVFLAPGIASASFVLDTGTPTSATGPETTGGDTLSASSFYAEEFYLTAGETVTQVAAYLNNTGAGAGNATNAFTFNIYHLGSSLVGDSASVRDQYIVATAAGSFSAQGWNSQALNWTASTSGDYWLAIEVGSGGTKGLDVPVESMATGTVPALSSAYTTVANGKYALSSTPVGMEVTATTPVPLPASAWLLGSSLLVGMGSAARRRRGIAAA